MKKKVTTKTVAKATAFSPDIVMIRCHAIMMKDEHGQVIYTFIKKKEADEFYKLLTTSKK